MSVKQKDEIIQRVEYIRNYMGLNKSRFSSEINMKPQTYNNFIGAQGSKPSIELLLGVVSRFGVNPLWLLTGKSAMFTEEGAAMAEGRRGGWAGHVADGVWPEAERVKTLESKLEALELRVGALEGTSSTELGELVAVLQRMNKQDPKAAQAEIAQLLKSLSQKA